jgi:hypothetical protein
MSGSTIEFGAPFIDVDEWREEPRRHRYVHGGFQDSHTRFSFYLPPPELYNGRLFQFLSGGAGGDEHALTKGGHVDTWVFDTVFEDLGGILIESNQGHFGNEGNTGLSGDLELFGASAQAAIYAKAFAQEAYGQAPCYSYVWGASGGGLRSITCIENRPDVWDGAVPFVIGDAGGSPQAQLLAYWWLYCRNRLHDIVDATEPGGSNDPFVELNDDEREALAALYRGGWNRGCETQLWASASWIFALSGLQMEDPSYFEDFWSKPGYAGHDRPEKLGRIVVDLRCKVSRIQSGAGGPGQMWLPALAGMGASSDQPDRGNSWGIAVDTDLGMDPNRFYMSRVTVLTGKAKGRKIFIAQQGELLVGERMTSPDMFDDVAVGDEIQIDNRMLVAFAHRWMHDINLDRWTVIDPVTGGRVLAPEYSGIGMSMVDGKPIYPQRANKGREVTQTGAFKRKVIHMAGTHDTIVPLTSVAHYHRMVRENHGDQTDETYRLWWMENACHGDPELLLPWTVPEKNPGIWRSRLVRYDGFIREALTSIADWVEKGIPPAPTTNYDFSRDSGLVLADTVQSRGGVQPIVKAEADGSLCANVKVGETVSFAGIAEQPPGTGSIVSARWDFEGTGDFGNAHILSGDDISVRLEATYAYSKPGTYFASFRVESHRDGIKGNGLPIQNGARVRVVVS